MGSIFPNKAAVMCLTVVLFLEHNNEWVAQPVRNMTLETTAPLSDDLTVDLSALVADPDSPRYPGTLLLSTRYDAIEANHTGPENAKDTA